MPERREIALMLWADHHFENATDDELALFAKAYQFSMANHTDRPRQSGESYYRHDCRIAARVLKAGFGMTLAAAMLIHEIIEDDYWTVEQVAEKFGQEIAKIVNAVSKRSKSEFPLREDRLNDHLLRMREVIPNCWQVAVAKCVDRLDNATDTAALSAEEKLQLFTETEDYFLPLFAWSTKYIPKKYQSFYLIYIQEIEFACDNFRRTQFYESHSP